MEKQPLRSVESQETLVDSAAADRPAYQAPRVTVMSEADVLKAFQFTSAGITWWVM
jgi:hypothetical protein